MKAIVLETRGRRAAVLAKDGTVRVARGEYSVGDIIDYHASARPGLRQWAAAAAAMVILLGASAGMWVDRNYVAYAEVSLDVNPSIVYTLNKRDRVLGVRAANADAEAIVERLEAQDIRFAVLSDAVEQTMEILDDAGYLDADEEDYVLLNVSADDDARQDRLTEQIESAMTDTRERDATLEYRVDHSDRATAKQARDSGMSTGRFAAWQASEQDDDGAEKPDRETYEKKPVRELLGHEAPKGEAPDVKQDTPQVEQDAPKVEQAAEPDMKSEAPQEKAPEDKPASAKSEKPATDSGERTDPPSEKSEKPAPSDGGKADPPSERRDNGPNSGGSDSVGSRGSGSREGGSRNGGDHDRGISHDNGGHGDSGPGGGPGHP